MFTANMTVEFVDIASVFSEIKIHSTPADAYLTWEDIFPETAAAPHPPPIYSFWLLREKKDHKRRDKLMKNTR